MVWPRWALGNHRKLPSSSSCSPSRFRPPRRRPPAPSLFWLHPATRLLWHIHRSSSALFCVLMALNMLAGVRPFSAQNNHILEEELRKNMVSTDNGTVSSAEEDELTREILTLFDYEDRWLKNARKSDRNVENQTTMANESYPIPSPIDQYIQFNTDQEAENGTSSHPINGNGIEQKLPSQDQSIIDNQLVSMEDITDKLSIKNTEHGDPKNDTLSSSTTMVFEMNSTATLPYDVDSTIASNINTVIEKSSTIETTNSAADDVFFTTNSTPFYETVQMAERSYQNGRNDTVTENWNETIIAENGAKNGQNETGEVENEFSKSTTSTIAVESKSSEIETSNFTKSRVDGQNVTTTMISSLTTKDNSNNETASSPTATMEDKAATGTGNQSITESTTIASITLDTVSNSSTTSKNEANYSTTPNYSSINTSAQFVTSTMVNNVSRIETKTASNNNNVSNTSFNRESGTVSDIDSNITPDSEYSTQFATVSTNVVSDNDSVNNTMSSSSEVTESKNTVDSESTMEYNNSPLVNAELFSSTLSTVESEDKNEDGVNGTEISANQTSPTPKTEQNETESPTEIEGASGIEEMNKVVEERVLKKMLEELKSRVERRLGLGAAELIELTEYRKHLKQMLASVETALTKMPNGGRAAQHSDFPKSRRLITISSSLPDRNSELFIARKNAISESVLPPPSNGEEIRKSPPKGLSDPPGVGTPSSTPEEITTTMASSTQKQQQHFKTVSEPTTAATIKMTTKDDGLTAVHHHTTPAHPNNNNYSKSNYSTIQTSSSMAERTAPPTPTTTPPMEQLVPNAAPASSSVEQGSNSGGESDEQSVVNNPRKSGFFRAESFGSKYFPFVVPFRNNTAAAAEQCKHLSQEELVKELKYKGNYNPDLMAWDVSGVFRFLDKTITDQYERQFKPPKSSEQVVKRNVEALERLLAELNLRCDVRSPEVLSRMANLTMAEPKRSIISPTLRHRDQLMRYKRNSVLAEQLVHQTLNSSQQQQGTTHQQQSIPPPIRNKNKKQKMIGDVHVVPFGCDKRGGSEDGYLRLCGACQAIRKLPDEYFPPFINEVMCDEDKACLYFYDYPHGKCKQKHMNFVVLRNVGTQVCQIWEKFNLNVRVSCECFVDEMSFFSKYV